MAINENGNLQLQLGPLSGGGQIPLNQVIEAAKEAAGGVLSLDGRVGDVLILSADSSLDFQTPAPTVITVRGFNSVVAGTGIAVDNTDPANPVVSTPAKVASVVAGAGIAVNNTDPANPIVTATGATVPIGI